MQQDFLLLLYSTITVALLHTFAGPDHYLPFIALSKTLNWTYSKTIFWTLLCGLAHVASSIFIGSLGIAIGFNLNKITSFENMRGGLAGWAFVLFGLIYLLWAFYRLNTNKKHKHFELQNDNELYVYEHKHGTTVTSNQKHKVTPWVVFIIFLLGPCEPMIPLLYMPASTHSWADIFILIAIYTTITLIVMTIMVSLGFYGISILKNTTFLEKYINVIGAVTILLCGIGIVFIGW